MFTTFVKIIILKYIRTYFYLGYHCYFGLTIFSHIFNTNLNYSKKYSINNEYLSNSKHHILYAPIAIYRICIYQQ